MEPSKQKCEKCERCGAPAFVRIRPDAAEGSPIHRFCLECADNWVPDSPEDRGYIALNHAAVALGAGLFILLISCAADFLAFGQSAGFGRKQILGLGLAGLLLFVGTVLRISTLAVLGLLFGFLAILADVLGFGNTDGFGLQQVSGCVLGTVLIAIGWLAGRRRRCATAL